MNKQTRRNQSQPNPAGSISTSRLLALSLATAMTITSCGRKEQSAPHPDSSSAHSHSGPDTAAIHTHTADKAMTGKKQPTRLEFSSAPAVIKAGEPAVWTLKIVDQITGEPVKDFERVHERLMHLIVVSTDLSWFNHIHPEYKGDGVFTVSAVLPRPGSYKLYADHTPKEGTQVVSQHELATEGATPAPAMVSLAADTAGAGGWITGKFASAPEGEPEKKSGALYEVALMPMPMKLEAGKDMMLHFQIRDAAGRPISDLEPYLGAMGHLVIVSGDTRMFLHAHPMNGGMESMAGMDHGKMDHGSATPGAMGGTHSDAGTAPHEHTAPTSGGPDVIFHTNFPEPGQYRLWGQFQHKGRIITAVFTVLVGGAA